MVNVGAVSRKRFQTWELTGKGDIVGLWPIPEGHQPAGFVELEYDSNDRVMGIKEFSEGTRKPLRRRPSFDAQGRLQHSHYVDPNDGTKGKNSYEYDQRGMLRERWEQDPNGVLQFRIETICDDQGRFLEDKRFSNRGKVEDRHTYEYDAKGLMIRDTGYTGRTGEELKGFMTFAHDEKGRIVRRAWHDEQGKEVSVYCYKYNEFDRYTEMSVESQGATTISKREYDALGKVRSEKFEDESGNPAHGTAWFELDASGKPVELGIKGPATGFHVRDVLLAPEEPGTGADRDLHEGKVEIAELYSMKEEDLASLAKIAYDELQAGRLEKAKKIFRSLSALNRKDPHYLTGSGAASLALGELQTAVNSFNRALVHDPEYVPALIGKGTALMRLGKKDEALEPLQKFLKIVPPDDPRVGRAQALVSAIEQGKTGVSGGSSPVAPQKPAPGAQPRPKPKPLRKKW